MQNKHVLIASICFTFSLFMVLINEGDSKELKQNDVYEKYEIPKPLHKANQIDVAKSVYISVIDNEYKASNHQCILKKSWIDDVKKLEFVDDVELYSNVSFYNRDCDIYSIPTPPNQFNMKNNPTCVIMRNIISSYLKRSNAGWLLYVSDFAFVNARKLESLIDSLNCEHPDFQPQMAGQCTELRDYFQIFEKHSGAIISRYIATLLNNTEKIWNISCSIEIDGSEAISHALDIHNIYSISHNCPMFLGQPFTSRLYYDALITKNFHGIQTCPLKYESSRVCHATIQPISELAVWSGVGRYMNRSEFLIEAKDMMNVDFSVQYLYKVYESELCVV